jgi:hypothetical protein
MALTDVLTAPKRKIAILVMALVCLLGLGLLSVWWLRASIAQVRAFRSCQAFETFCNHVREGNWRAAQALVKPDDPSWFRVETGAVYYWDRDITQEISRTHPLLTETFEHRFHHPMSGNVVYFGYGCAGYAILQHGKIQFIKIP